MATQNYLTNEIAARTVFVEQLGNTTVRKAQRGLPSLLSDIRALLADTPTERLFVVAQQVEQLLLAALSERAEQVQLELEEYAEVEAAWTRLLLLEATSLETVRLPDLVILSSFTNQPMQNFVSGRDVSRETPRELLLRLASDRATQARNAIRAAQAGGIPAQQLARDVEGSIAAARRDIEATTLTLYQHTAAQSRQAVYSENADVIEGYRRVVTLDSRTSATCRGWGDELLELNTRQVPPYHYRCRTQLVPVVKQEFRIDIPGRERAAEGGPVDFTTGYGGWLKQQTKERQDQILGPTRAKAFRRGLNITKFTNDRGVSLTLEQLRTRYPDKFPEQ